MKHSLSLFATSVALALATAAQSQADPFQYSYNWGVTPDLIGAGPGIVSFFYNAGSGIH